MEGRRVVIVGANRLGQEIAGIIQAHGRPIILIDTNQSLANTARSAGLDAVQGNALDEDILEQSGIEEAETIIAITSNSEVNVLVSQLAHDVFGIKRAYPILLNPEKGADIRTLEKTGGKMGFGRPVDIYAWENVNIQHFLWEIPESWVYTPLKFAQIPGELLPVIRLRNGSAEVVYLEQDWKPKDTIVFLARISTQQAQDYLQEMSRPQSAQQFPV